MAERNTTDLLNLRLPLYAYTTPLWVGRRVLEIGCDDGDSATYLAGHGAAQVVVIDTDVSRIERARVDFPHSRVDYRPAADLRQMGGPDEAFDLIVVPEGRSLVANRNLLTVLRRILSPSGHILISVPAADRRTPAFSEGLGYYELVDALEAQFKVVRMLGRTPFIGFGLVEFDSTAEALRLDATLLEGETETPTHYIAIAGNTPAPPLGYALVQVPFAPVEARLAATMPEGGRADELAAAAAERVKLTAEVGQLRRQLEDARQAREAAARAPKPLPSVLTRGSVAATPATTPPPVPTSAMEATIAAGTRAELAERRLDEAEGRARIRLDEAESRLSELRRKLDEALVQSESAVRVSRVQGEEIEELRGRLRRAAEDRAASDAELAKLRRALAEADESVMKLTRRTAEEMTAVAERIGVGLRAPQSMAERAFVDAGGARGDGERDRALGDAAARVRHAEESVARDRAEIGALTEKLRAADEQLRALEENAALVAEREARIIQLDGDKHELIWKVGELEVKLRQAESRASAAAATLAAARPAAAAPTPPASAPPASINDSRDQAIREFHRLAAAHAAEVQRLRSSVDEQAALVVELEDALRVAEARAVAAEAEATTLRRNSKGLEDADRARRGRLAELEGKLLRLEREKSGGREAAGLGGAGGVSPDVADLQQRLASMEQRALAAEQHAVGLEERLAAANLRAGGPLAASALFDSAEGPPASAADDLEQSAAVARSVPLPANGAHTEPPTAEIHAAIDEVEQQLRHELRMLAAIEETLARARDEMAHVRNDGGGASAGGADASELAQALAAKDAQLIEGRLELTRLRRDAEARQTHLEREVGELRAKLNPLGHYQEDQSQSTQLILMHTTLANIRRRAARLRDELEGFRRRLDSIPAGALSSLLEEIGEDLSEFAR